MCKVIAAWCYKSNWFNFHIHKLKMSSHLIFSTINFVWRRCPLLTVCAKFPKWCLMWLLSSTFSPYVYDSFIFSYKGAFNNYVDKMRGGVKKCLICPRSRYRNCGVGKKGQNSVHVVVECPLTDFNVLRYSNMIFIFNSRLN